jgi:hypothetical protein|nr:MAG TPA_asm: hypothetical protein [Caudoviricetes sp.]
MEIIKFGKEKKQNEWRINAILGFCHSRANCRLCPLSKTTCYRRKKTLTDLSVDEQKEALRIIVKEDF